MRSCLIGLLDYQKTLYSERDGALDDFNDETAACGVPYPSYEDVFSDSIRSVSEPFKEFLKTFAKDLKISAKDIAVILKKEIQIHRLLNLVMQYLYLILCAILYHLLP